MWIGETLKKLILFILFPIVCFSIDTTKVLQNQILLDHVNIAVTNLEKAKTWYSEKLGFSIKQGRLHQNSIFSAFIEFENGTELELITAKEPKDELAKWYINFIEKNPKGTAAFTALRLADKNVMNLLKNHLESKRIRFDLTSTGYSAKLSFPEVSNFHKLFFIRYFQTVENEKIYTIHPNGAKRLLAVWLTKKSEKIKELGFSPNSRIKLPYFESSIQEYSLKNGHIYLFPSEKDVRVFGITIEVENIRKAKKTIEDNLQLDIRFFNLNRGKSFILSPEYTFGIWMEFLEISKQIY